MMKVKDDDIRQRIALATIDCIEQEGLHHVRVRAIARRAGVNVAAVNYYFGSKEKLVQATLDQALEHAFGDWAEILKARPGDPRTAIREFLTYSLDGIVRFPGITKAHLNAPLHQNNFTGSFVARFNKVLFDLANAMEHQPRYQGQGAMLRMAMTQIVSAVMFPGLMPGFFAKVGCDLRDPKNQKRYIDDLMRRYFPE